MPERGSVTAARLKRSARHDAGAFPRQASTAPAAIEPVVSAVAVGDKIILDGSGYAPNSPVSLPCWRGSARCHRRPAAALPRPTPRPRRRSPRTLPKRWAVQPRFPRPPGSRRKKPWFPMAVGGISVLIAAGGGIIIAGRNGRRRS